MFSKCAAATACRGLCSSLQNSLAKAAITQGMKEGKGRKLNERDEQIDE